MKFLLLGATGRTGKPLLEQALERGHEVHALVRYPEKVNRQDAHLKIFKGTPADKTALQTAIEGCKGVLSVLNISRKSDFPWAPLRTPPDFLSTTLQKVMACMQKEGIQKIVITTAWGCNETFQEIPAWFRWFITNSNIGVTYRDHEVQEKLLAASGLHWTAVRPVGLTNAGKIKELVVSFGAQPKPRLTISRAHVAKFMLDCVENGNYVGKMPTISER